jgi:hypothetical protein
MGRMKELDILIRQGGDDAVAAVNELLHVWTPVSERLPDEEVLVLAYWPVSPLGGKPEIEIVYRRRGKWEGSFQLCQAPPTHWMLLPARPASSNTLRMEWHLSRLRALPDELEREFRARFPPSPYLDAVVYILRNTVTELDSSIKSRLAECGVPPHNVSFGRANACTASRKKKPKS